MSSIKEGSSRLFFFPASFNKDNQMLYCWTMLELAFFCITEHLKTQCFKTKTAYLLLALRVHNLGGAQQAGLLVLAGEHMCLWSAGSRWPHSGDCGPEGCERLGHVSLVPLQASWSFLAW